MKQHMNSILKLKGTELILQSWLKNRLHELCRKNPLSAHCYATYYPIREPNRTEIVLMVSDGSVESYALIRYGGKFTIMGIYEIHIWNPVSDVVSEINIFPTKRADIQLYNSVPNDIGIIVNHFRSLGFRRFYVGEFYDMICDRESFKPSPLERLAVKLREKHAPLYRDLEVERGIEISIDEAREILKTYTHYGVIIDNTLVSIAARYVTLPEIHIVGGVFTRKKFRGKGYAKAATSALTRETVASGTFAGLHVEIDNKAAIGIYRKLGYKTIRTRPWIFMYP